MAGFPSSHHPPPPPPPPPPLVPLPAVPGVTAPPWLKGSNTGSLAGPPMMPHNFASGNPPHFGGMPPHPPAFATAGSAASYTPMQMQSRPMAPLLPGQQFNPHLRPTGLQSPNAFSTVSPVNMLGITPSNMPTMQAQNTQFPSQMQRGGNQPSQLLLPSQMVSYSQQPKLTTVVDSRASLQQPAPSFSIPPPGPVRVIAPPTFTFAVPQQNSKVTTVSFPPLPTPLPQVQAPPTGNALAWPTVSNQVTLQTPQQTSQPLKIAVDIPVMSATQTLLSEWQEHNAPDGRRYYYNKRTKVSVWEKPYELMTSLERADASTIWKEFTAQDGRKYYYNKVTKQSKWTMPEEMKVAREKVMAQADSETPVASTTVTASSPAPTVSSSPVPNVPVVESRLAISTVDSAVQMEPDSSTIDPMLTIHDTKTTDNVDVNARMEIASDIQNQVEPVNEPSSKSEEGLAQVMEETNKDVAEMQMVATVNVTEEKFPLVAEEPLNYATKLEAKNAFKELLESVNVEAESTWDQVLRLIVNDKRYGALKSLSERKQAFTEYVTERKKQKAEEKRAKQKKVREDFLAMLQECNDLSHTMRWSKVSPFFSEDPRCHAIEKEREREEIFEDYRVELERKAREERKRNFLEYRSFLESCDFVKANTQWRKVADKLEEDERCSRLDSLDQIRIFEEYVAYLEKQEEEDKKAQKEQQRRQERRNRDEFRKLLEEHISTGALHACVDWREYILMVKEHPSYQAVCSNTSGNTPKELFEDVMEDINKQYQDDRARIRDTIQIERINIVPSWTLEQFKEIISEVGAFTAVGHSNLKLIFEELLKRAKEKEEQDAKKFKRAADDFNALLRAERSITQLSKWEDCEALLELAPEFKALTDESVRKKLFDDHVTYLQQKIREREKKREEEKGKKEKEKVKDQEREKERSRDREKKKDKEKKEKERAKEKSSKRDKDERKREKEKEKDKDKKHKKHHHGKSSNEQNSEKLSKEEDAKRGHKHSRDKRKSSRKHAHDSASEGDHKHKRHRKNHERVDDVKDGELGEDGEIR